MLNMEWTKAYTLQFIELWQGLPCLWNTKDVNYKNRQKRHDALSYLAQEMGTDTFAIEKKIISLKTQYNREIKKLRSQSGAGLDEDDIPQSNWYAFERLTFLKDINVSMPNTDSLMTLSLSTPAPSGYPDMPSPSKPMPSPPPTIWIQSPALTQLPKRKQNTNIYEDVQTTKPIKDRKTNDSDDEITVFGIYVAAQLRKLRPILQSKLKLDIQALLCKYEIKNIEYDRPDSSASDNTD